MPENFQYQKRHIRNSFFNPSELLHFQVGVNEDFDKQAIIIEIPVEMCEFTRIVRNIFDGSCFWTEFLSVYGFEVVLPDVGQDMNEWSCW